MGCLIFSRLSLMNLATGLLCFLAVGCSKVSETQSKKILPATAATNNHRSSDDAQRLVLPSWCSVQETADLVCFRCEREDAGIKIPYEQCLQPGPEFSSSAQCSFTSGFTKVITCEGTKSGEPFKMDASIAKEKVATAIPAFMIGLDLIVRQKFADDSLVAKLTSDLSAFWSSRIPALMRGEGYETTASDLVLLVNRHLKTPLSEDQVTHFKQVTKTALGELNQELSGKKDYKLSQVILRGLYLAKSIPENILGEAAPLFTGPAIADLLRDDKAKALLSLFSSMNPSVLGISSLDTFIEELSAAQ